MPDTGTGDWSDSGRPQFKKKDDRKKGPSDLMRIMYPISNLAAMRKGGKVRKKSRGKSRRK